MPLSRRVRHAHALCLAVAGLAMCAVGARAATPHPTSGMFVGAGPGGGPLVAIVTGQRHRRPFAIAYACDSKRLAAWFEGPIRHDRLDLRARGYRLTATLHADTAVGTLTLPSSDPIRFTVNRTATRGHAGLYRAAKTVHGKRIVGGWILLPHGRQRGATLIIERNAPLLIKPAPTLNPESQTVQIPDAGATPVTKITEGAVLTV